jgi:hypothetical protein
MQNWRFYAKINNYIAYILNVTFSCIMSIFVYRSQHSSVETRFIASRVLAVPTGLLVKGVL